MAGLHAHYSWMTFSCLVCIDQHVIFCAHPPALDVDLITARGRLSLQKITTSSSSYTKTHNLSYLFLSIWNLTAHCRWWPWFPAWVQQRGFHEGSFFAATSFMRTHSHSAGDSRQNENKRNPPLTKLPILSSCIAPQTSLFTQSLNFLPPWPLKCKIKVTLETHLCQNWF